MKKITIVYYFCCMIVCLCIFVNLWSAKQSRDFMKTHETYLVKNYHEGFVDGMYCTKAIVEGMNHRKAFEKFHKYPEGLQWEEGI